MFQASGCFFLLVLSAGVVHQCRDRQITLGLRLLLRRWFRRPLHVRYGRLIGFRRQTVHIRKFMVLPVFLRMSLQIGTGILKQRLGGQCAFGELNRVLTVGTAYRFRANLPDLVGVRDSDALVLHHNGLNLRAQGIRHMAGDPRRNEIKIRRKSRREGVHSLATCCI